MGDRGGRFLAIWKATGGLFECWPSAAGISFQKPGEKPFRSLPVEEFWKLFRPQDDDAVKPKRVKGRNPDQFKLF